VIGAGISVLWNDRLATYLYHDGEVGRSNYASHSVSAGIRLTF
jgi:outer membrane autotransporter protein